MIDREGFVVKDALCPYQLESGMLACCLVGVSLVFACSGSDKKTPVCIVSTFDIIRDGTMYFLDNATVQC